MPEYINPEPNKPFFSDEDIILTIKKLIKEGSTKEGLILVELCKRAKIDLWKKSTKHLEKMADDILENRHSYNKCLDASICPKCGGKLSVYTDFVGDHIDTEYNCPNCGFSDFEID